jgi:hypothetical protein
MTRIKLEGRDILNLLVLHDLADLNILRYVICEFVTNYSIIGNLLNYIHTSRKASLHRRERKMFLLGREEIEPKEGITLRQLLMLSRVRPQNHETKITYGLNFLFLFYKIWSVLIPGYFQIVKREIFLNVFSSA